MSSYRNQPLCPDSKPILPLQGLSAADPDFLDDRRITPGNAASIGGTQTQLGDNQRTGFLFPVRSLGRPRSRRFRTTLLDSVLLRSVSGTQAMAGENKIALFTKAEECRNHSCLSTDLKPPAFSSNLEEATKISDDIELIADIGEGKKKTIFVIKRLYHIKDEDQDVSHLDLVHDKKSWRFSRAP